MTIIKDKTSLFINLTLNSIQSLRIKTKKSFRFLPGFVLGYLYLLRGDHTTREHFSSGQSGGSMLLMFSLYHYRIYGLVLT